MKSLMIVAAMAFVAAFAFAQDVEIVKVKGRGVGANKTEALKDAYRDAVERAVGLYVDAEQMMKNEELVKDQILTQSNAYIEKCEVAKEMAKSNGLVEIQILAEVRKTALTKKISDVMPSKTFKLSDGLKNVHAKMTTTEKRNVDGAALLKNALEGFRPVVLVAECELASPQHVIRKMGHPRDPKNMIAVNYLFRTKINQQRYLEYVVPRLKDVLGQISLSEPRAVSIPIRINRSGDVETMVAEARRREGGGLDYEHDATVAIWQNPRWLENVILDNPGSEDAVGFFVLVTGVNKYRTSATGIRYEVDEASQKVIGKWINAETSSLEFSAAILDSAGETIAVKKIVPYSNGWGILRWSTSDWRQSNGQWMNVTMIAPLGGSQSGFVFEDFTWHEFVIPKDALPEVKDMKIEIVK